MATNDEILGKPVEFTTRPPVKQFDRSASSRALVAGAEQLASLGLQADQALATNRLRSDLNDTVAAYESVQSYATGESTDIFTGDEDVDRQVRAMVGEMDDVREAVRQGVMLPEIGKARLETVLKRAKANRPAYADQLNQIAGEVLGFNVQGYATRKLFAPEADAKLSPQQKLRNTIVEKAKVKLYERGMGAQVFELDDRVAVNMASKLEGVSARQQDALVDIQLDKANSEQFGRLVGKVANKWTNASIDAQLIGFQSRLVNAPVDPEARSQWNRENVPKAITDLQRLRTSLRPNFMASMELAYGEEAVANMDAAAIDRSLEPAYARIDQMIEDFQDPVLLNQYQKSIELDMVGIQQRALDESPAMRNYLGLFSPDGRDQALLSMSVSGVISKQRLGETIAKELDVFMGIAPEGSGREGQQTAEAGNLTFASIAGSDTPEEALGAFGDYVNNANESWFTVDIESPTEQVKAANAFALRATANIDHITDGSIEKGKEIEALEKTRNAIQGMLMVPAREQVIELPTTAALLNKINSPETRELEAKYGVDFSEQRNELTERLRRDTTDFRSTYRRVLRNNTTTVRAPLTNDEVTVRPLQYTTFIFNEGTGVITAGVDRTGIRNKLRKVAAPTTSVFRNAEKAYTASAAAFNNANSGYRDGVAGVFFNTYNNIKQAKGSVDIQDSDTAYQLAGTGIMVDLGFVDPNLGDDVASYMRAVRQDPSQRPSDNAPLAHKLAYEWYQTPSMVGQGAASGSLEDQADALSLMYQAGLMREYERTGKLRFQ